eukprot:COSAG05_NODE_2823_length_2599_cov_4.405600_2_plen_67_part_00
MRSTAEVGICGHLSASQLTGRSACLPAAGATRLSLAGYDDRRNTTADVVAHGHRVLRGDYVYFDRL